MKRMNPFALAGLVLILPSSALVCFGLLDLTLPGILLHPILVVGGLLTAFGLNLFSIAQVATDRGPDGVAAVTLRIGLKPANLAVCLLSSLLMAFIAAYLFVENFQPRLLE